MYDQKCLSFCSSALKKCKDINLYSLQIHILTALQVHLKMETHVAMYVLLSKCGIYISTEDHCSLVEEQHIWSKIFCFFFFCLSFKQILKTFFFLDRKGGHGEVINRAEWFIIMMNNMLIKFSLKIVGIWLFDHNLINFLRLFTNSF